MRDPLFFVRRVLAVLRHTLRRSQVERDAAEEMRTHVEFETEDRIRRGMDPIEARRSSIALFGGLQPALEGARDARGLRPWLDVRGDVVYTMRSLRRSPVFALTTCLTIALGMAAVTVVVSGVQALLLRPLAVKDPATLVVYGERPMNSTSMSMPRLSYARFLAISENAGRILPDVGGFSYFVHALRVGDAAESVSGMVVSANYFRLLGIQPVVGRLFSSDLEAELRGRDEIVISDRIWQQRFAGRRDVVGEVLHVDSKPYTVIGVLATGVGQILPAIPVDMWTPSASEVTVDSLGRVRGPAMTIIGRLANDVTRDEAATALTSIAKRIDPGVVDVRLEPLTAIPAMSRMATSAFFAVLGAAAALILLIAATNVAAMFLARATHRQREISVRLALGASRWRIARQLLAEGLAIAAGASLVGMGLAWWIIDLIRIWMSTLVLPTGGFSPQLDLPLSPSVLAWSMAVAVITGLATGLVPALRSTRDGPMSVLRGTATTGRREGGMRRALVVTQIACSLALLVAAGLFARALQRALRTDPGFDPSGVTVATVNLNGHGYTRARGIALQAMLRDRLQERVGAEGVALGNNLPLGGSHNGEGVLPPASIDSSVQRIHVTWGMADAAVQSVLRLPLLRGRWISTADGPGAPDVAVVNASLAERLWPGVDALGQRFRLAGRDREVVGIMRDGKYRSLDEGTGAFAFVPLAQQPSNEFRVLVRGREGTAASVRAMREALSSIDPNIALAGAGPMEGTIDLWRAPQRVAAWLIGALGMVGLVLSAVAIYGALAYQVSLRAREFGIRLAVGATPRRLQRLVLRDGARLALVGIVIGLFLAIAVSLPLSRFLYGVAPFNLPVLVGTSTVMFAVALLAAYVPSRRSARTSPISSMRLE